MSGGDFLWRFSLTYAVIGIVAYLVWRHMKERAAERRRKGKERLGQILPKPEITELDGSSHVKGSGQIGYGKTEAEARDAWLDRIWRDIQNQ